MKKWMTVLALAGLASIAIWFVGFSPAEAPPVSFTSIQGQHFALQDLRGKVVLVRFWATNCSTCIKQMPNTIADFERYHAQGFETIAVAMQYDSPDHVLNYAQTRRLPFPVVLDTDGKLAQAFGNVRLVPTAFLINKHGHILKRYLGSVDPENFHLELEKALAIE